MNSVDRPLGGIGRVALTVALLVGVALLVAIPDPVSVLNFAAYAGVGSFVAVRRPHNPIGWILIVIAFGFITTSASSLPDDIDAVKVGTASTADFLAAWVGAWAGGVALLSFAALAMLFPSGRLSAGRRWRRVELGSFALGIGAVAVGAFAPKIPFSPDGGLTNFMIDNRFALIPPTDFESPVPGEVVFMIPIGAFAVGVLSAVLRYRRAAGVERLQLRWLMTSIAFAFAALVAGLVGFAIVGPQVGLLVWIPAAVAYPTIPLAVGVAVMRYRLFDIDRIISRTIAYGAITAVLFAVFAIVNLAVQTALQSVVTGNTVAVAVSTLAVAALFNPLRMRLQRAVDRRFNRARYDAERTAIVFTERLRDQVDLASLRGDITGVVNATLRPSKIGVWIRRPGRGETQ